MGQLLARRKEYYKEHKDIFAANSKRWHANPENKKKANERKRKERKTNRETVLKHYGGKCDCCGELRFEFLAIDHIDGNGNQHRRANNIKNIGIASWLLRNELPEGFRVLCHNCNLAMGFYGYCPHKAAKSEGE